MNGQSPGTRSPAGRASALPGRLARRTGLYLMLVLAAVFSIGPLVWLVAGSFVRGGDPTDLVTRPPTLHNYIRLLRDLPLADWLVNSLFLSSTYTLVVVLLSSLGGFALAKYRFRGRRAMVAIMLGTMLLPSQLLLSSSYELMLCFGWIDSYAAIIVPSAVSVFGIFLFMGAMRSVPDDLLASGRIDGCLEIGLWWRIAMPAARPMTGAFTLLSFLSAWNSFLWPQVILQDPGKYPLSIGLARLLALQQYQADAGLLMACTVVSILPVALLFFALQRDFVAGLSSGALKG